MKHHLVRRNAVRTAGVLAAVLATLAGAAGVGVAESAPSTAAARKSPTWATGTGVLALNWGDLDKTPEASGSDVVVMQSWEFARIPQLRRDNPGITILMYKDASATVQEASTTGLFPAGMGYDWVAAKHPSWILRDASGHVLEWSDWRGLYPMDVAKLGYQRTWSRNVIGELRAHDWDGVMMDDVLTVLSHPTVNGRVSPTNPTDATQYAATSSFLSHVAPKVRRAGYLAVPNLSVEWNNWQTTLKDWTRHVSGWVNEHFTNWPGSSTRFVGADWRWKFDVARWLAARNVPLLAITYGSANDEVGQTYHRATWLLSWNGTTGASSYVPNQATASHFQPTANQQVGRPTGPATERPDGTWIRTFSGGTVAVNPTDSAHSVDLGNRTVRLAPTTAAIVAR